MTIRERSLFQVRAHRCVGVIVALLVMTAAPALAADRTNIPLKNWGGFAIYRDAVYDDLERLVTAGLADRTILNTKPLSRVEAARAVARAIRAIRNDSAGAYNNRQDLEPVLTRLTNELRTELAQIGVQVPGPQPTLPGTFSFTPVDRAQVRGGYASRDLSLINSQGLRFQEGVNGGLTFESRAQIGDWVTFYLQPELVGNQEFGQARVATGYLKLTAFNVELVAGRESLWWGPALHGSLIMSNNAPPLDHVRIGAAEPFQLPLIGEWIGPTKIMAFFAKLEERRDIARADVAGLRGTISPFSFLELGASYVNIFGGDQSPRLRGASDYLRVLFDPVASDQDVARTDERFRNNALFALDADIRIPNLQRFMLPVQDARIYGEFGWDDTCCSTAFVPLREAASYLFGLHLLGLFGDEGLDWRFEYATSSRLSYTHNQFFNGYWTRGEVISHFMGREGSDVLTRVTKRFDNDFMVGINVNRAQIGNTVLNADSPRERRIGAAVDVSYRFGSVYTLFAQAQVMHATNRNFVAGDDGFDGLVLFELTRSFR